MAEITGSDDGQAETSGQWRTRNFGKEHTFGVFGLDPSGAGRSSPVGNVTLYGVTGVLDLCPTCRQALLLIDGRPQYPMSVRRDKNGSTHLTPHSPDCPEVAERPAAGDSDA